MQLLGINHLEVKIVCGLGGGSVLVPIRVFASNPTGYALRVDTYYEVRHVNHHKIYVHQLRTMSENLKH